MLAVMAVHFVSLPTVARVQFTAVDGNLMDGVALALEVSDSEPSKGRAWIVKPRAGLPGDVVRVPIEDIVSFQW
jgi:hypothetical protein